MRAEYLLFNLLVITGPLLLSFYPPSFFADRWGKALRAVSAVAVPFLVWDALVAGRHWDFNPRYVLGPRIAGLPIEEVMFFWTVPLACIFSWFSIIRPHKGRGPDSRLWPLYVPVVAMAPLGGWLFSLGKEYTGLALIALAAAATLDLALRTRLLLRPRFYAYLALVSVFTLVFNNYLTGRPIVTYGVEYQLDFRIVTMPVEDWIYGIALNWMGLAGFEFLGRRQSLLSRLIERRLGGYRQELGRVDASLPARVRDGRAARVAVIGGGLAGITAAARLAQRGLDVHLIEKNPYLGGKVGAWTDEGPGGPWAVEHGFHAFFGHYYNMRELFRDAGVDRNYRRIDDYKILRTSGEAVGFHGVSPTPLVNLVSMAGHGVYRLRDVAFKKPGDTMEDILRYRRDEVFAHWDHVSFQEFADMAELPDDLRLVFNTFSRAFFADAKSMSAAELMKSFHFYYLSNDSGLLYDFMDDDYSKSLLAPLRRFLESQGCAVKLGCGVEALAHGPGGGADGEVFVVETSDGESREFDHVVLAADVVGTRSILRASSGLCDAHPQLRATADALREGQRYAVLKLWLDRDTPRSATLPVFVITERDRVLDAVTFYHRVTKEAARFVESHPGAAVIELHCYAVPDELESDEVHDQFLDEFFAFFPELRGAVVLHESLQIRRDFPAFHVGQFATRPEVESSVPGLRFAGDWVKLPTPAMLMEAACTSGLLAANSILDAEKLRRFPVFTVPLEGALAGLPRKPGTQAGPGQIRL